MADVRGHLNSQLNVSRTPGATLAAPDPEPPDPEPAPTALDPDSADVAVSVGSYDLVRQAEADEADRSDRCSVMQETVFDVQERNRLPKAAMTPPDSAAASAAAVNTASGKSDLAVSATHSSPSECEKYPSLPSHQLPPFTPAESAHFTWGMLKGEEVISTVGRIYEEAVHWKRNIFSVPSGPAGKKFVLEMARLFQAFADKSALERIALKAAMVMPLLVLQKPNPKSKARDHIACLSRRLDDWDNGRFDALVKEGRAIQDYLKIHSRADDRFKEERLSHTFAKLMMAGRTASALRLLRDSERGGLLRLSEQAEGYPEGTTVIDVLEQKHPPAQPVLAESIASEERRQPETHPVLFEAITESTIKNATMKTFGSAGPSGIDADGWRRLCNSFRTASQSLRSALAATARRMCTELIDPATVESLLSCRLIPIDKSPGVRPIGVCEVARRIIGKAVLSVTGPFIQKAAGSLQVCAGQEAGIEAAIHAMRYIAEQDETEAVLLIDAKNAFNSLNRKTALINIGIICPTLSSFLTNTYRDPTHLFVDGQTLLSYEGVTQGDPLAMPMYAIASVPLIDRISTANSPQVWYADDATTGGKLTAVREWWDKLSSLGPSYGYYPNEPKSWLIVKEAVREDAEIVFANTGIQITSIGMRHLGSALGSEAFIQDFIQLKTSSWISEVECLSKFAQTQPHAAYSAYTHGLVGRWKYLCRTLPNVAPLLQPLETVIRTKFLPAVTGRNPLNDQERDLLALPTRHGGMGLTNPTTLGHEHAASKAISKPLAERIIAQNPEIGDVRGIQWKLKQDGKREKQARLSEEAKQVHNRLPAALQRPVELACEKGASSWLTALPLSVHGFCLHKGAFRDAVCLRYNWQPDRLPLTCACGEQFSVRHALSCPTGGFPSIRHNELRDMCGDLLSEVCSNVCTEPHLQPLTGEGVENASDGARLDVAANGFWGGRYERTFFDVKVVNPFASSYQNSQIQSVYKRCERQKRQKYEARIREVEHATFTPLIWSTSGGAGPACTWFLKRLACMLADKRDEPYSVTMAWLRCRISFSLLRASTMCIRGARSSKHHPVSNRSAELAQAETNFS